MKKFELGFVAAGSVLTILFLFAVNFLTSPNYPWFIYPAFSLVLIPVGLYCIQKKKHLLFSFLCSGLLLIYLIIENYMNTPDYPWVLYAIAPIVMWPILVMLGSLNKTMTVSIVGSSAFIIYYLLLYTFLSPGHPWVIYPAFAILWWPLSLYHAKRKAYFKFSISATLLISIFFITVNAVTSPQVIWSVYPIFGVVWWPLSMYYFSYKPRKYNQA